LFDDQAQSTLTDQAKQWDGSLNYGKAVNLLPGEEPVPVNPGRPNAQFDPFVQAIIMQIGMALEIPYEVLAMRFNASYSASRAALLAAWRLFRRRRDWLASRMCQPVYELFLEEAILMGRIAAPGFFADPIIRAAWCKAQWVGDGPGSIDPEKEVTAAKLRVDLGISTLAAESIAYDGQPWDVKHKQRVREHEDRVEGDLEVSPNLQSQAALETAAGEPPEDQETEDPAEELALARACEIDAMRQAIAVLQGQLETLAKTPSTINVAPPAVTIAEGAVQVHSHIQAFPSRTEKSVVRDGDGLATKVIEEHRG
jgi:capsid protein